MAPSLHRRAGDDASNTHTSRSETRDTAGVPMSPWLIIVIVIGALIVTALVAFLVLYLVKRRRRVASEGQVDPLGRHDLRKKKLNATDRVAAEEMERAIMIRKSLASRSSWTTNGSRMSGTSEYQLEEFDREEREPTAPKDNWKELEAGSQEQRVTPGVHDTQMGVHPALLRQPQPQPQLAVPQPSRAPSPMR
ncbi:hypothetical protein F4819DRAFT_472935 [Hypoxylon fuscum]|nr:hypothetical protein F4819DRAFT_472935 [Hypoxylon fuscum]